MSSYEEKLKSLGFELPEPPTPGGDYVPFRRVGNLLYCSGVICTQHGSMTHTGKVGKEHTVESGAEGAQVCALNVLSVIKMAAGSLDKVKQFVFLSGYVNGVEGFAQSPQVINGASQLIGSVFGEAGKHSRAAVTVAGLPADSTVEIQAVVELYEA
jgi:enamine deaminase RidA (YjgF/YER057c/UK114 family)